MWLPTQKYAGLSPLGRDAVVSRPSMWLHRYEEKYDRCNSTEEEVLRMLEKEWGLKQVSASPLPSYDDSNWKIRDEKQQYVLKIASAGAECRGKCDAATTVRALECEGRIMHTLEKQLAPTVVNTRSGKMTALVGKERYARLSTWIEGENISNVIRDSKYRKELLGKVGSLLAQVLTKLQDFDDLGVAAARPLSWDLRAADSVRKYLPLVRDKERKELARRGLDRFCLLLQRVHALPSQIIHGDLNDENVILRPDNTLGVIDFGDFCKAPRIVEIAVSLAYMLFSSSTNPHEVIDEIKIILSAFDAKTQLPLSQEERALLLPLIAARNCQTVLTAQYRLNLDPTDPYVAISAEPAWSLLTKIDSLPSQDLNTLLSKASQSTRAVPAEKSTHDANPLSPKTRQLPDEKVPCPNDFEEADYKPNLFFKLGASAAVAATGVLVTIFLSRRRHR